MATTTAGTYEAQPNNGIDQQAGVGHTAGVGHHAGIGSHQNGAHYTGVTDGATDGTTGSDFVNPSTTRARSHGRHTGFGSSRRHAVNPYPNVNTTIFLRPIAPPAAIGLSGFVIATFVVGAYLAGWFGDDTAPLAFAPLLVFVGGFSQFVTAFYCLWARDILFSVIHIVWGGFFLSLGALYILVAAGAVNSMSVFEHFSAVGMWFIPLAFLTWSMALGAFRRDFISFFALVFLAMGATLSCSLLGSKRVHNGMKAAGYFYLFAAALAWWRVTVFIAEEAYGETTSLIKLFPLFRTRRELDLAPVVPGFGEPGVQPGIQSLHKYEWSNTTENYMAEKAGMGTARA